MTVLRLMVALLAGTSVAGAQLGGPAPPDREPLRNGFLTAAETVLDDVHAVHFSDSSVAVDGQVSVVRSAQSNLESMAENDREHMVATKMRDVIFALEACRIVATDGQDSTACQAREARAEGYVLEAMGVHRDGTRWVANIRS